MPNNAAKETRSPATVTIPVQAVVELELQALEMFAELVKGLNFENEIKRVISEAAVCSHGH